jgi:hypothetical protein
MNRRRAARSSSVRLLLRVLYPLVGWPHGVARVPTAGGAALAAAHRVVHRVHGDAAVVRPPPSQRLRPALPSEMFMWSMFRPGRWWRSSRRGPCAPRPRAADLRVAPSFAMSCAPAPAERASWPPLPILQLDVVDHRAERDVRSGSALPGVDRRLAGDHLVAHLSPSGPEDVALLAVGVVQQRDARRAVRVVLDRRDGAGDADACRAGSRSAVPPLVAAAAEPTWCSPWLLRAPRRLLALGEGLCGSVGGDLLEGRVGLLAARRVRRLDLFDSHGLATVVPNARRTRCAARGAAPARPRNSMPHVRPSSSPGGGRRSGPGGGSCREPGDPHLGDLALELRLDGLLDLDLVRPRPTSKATMLRSSRCRSTSR